jgi:hypothetical protein
MLCPSEHYPLSIDSFIASKLIEREAVCGVEVSPTFLRTYATEVSENLDYLPTWPPDSDVKLGDVGVLDGSVFRRTDTLEALGIGRPHVRRGQGTQVLEFSSSNGVEISWLGGAEAALDQLAAEVEIRFSREGAVFLRIGPHTLDQFESTDHLGREIIHQYESGAWMRNRVVVTEVVKAASATILVSGKGAAGAKFRLDSSLPGGEALARGKLSQIMSLTGSFTTKIVGEGISPLLRTSGLRGLFRTEFRTGKPAPTKEHEKVKFGRVDSSVELEE